jgi:hypothetical protein
MTRAIMDRHWRWLDSLLVKEKYTQANYWSTCMWQDYNFLRNIRSYYLSRDPHHISRILDLHRLRLGMILTSCDSQISEEILDFGNMSLDSLCDIWVYTLHWCTLLTTIICFPNWGMNMLKLCWKGIYDIFALI